MKKNLCLALCVLLAATVLFGCGASETPAPAPVEDSASDTVVEDELPVSLWNHSEVTFATFAMRPSASEEWPDDWDAQIDLHAGEAYDIWLGIAEDEIVLYDIELIDMNGDIWSLLEVPLGQGSELLVFDETYAWAGAMGGTETDIEVIFTNTEDDGDDPDEPPEEAGPVGVWEVRVGDDEPNGEMELLEDGTLITRANDGGEVVSTYSLEEDALTLHYDDFDLTFRLDGDIIYTQSGGEYAFRQ